MSNYSNYRLIVNGTTITNDLVQKGTYEFTKEKRIPSSWKDANEVEHQHVMSNRRTVISFALRERTLTEQDSIKGLFATQENVLCTYWDDYDCEYKTGTFYMTAPKINHLNTVNGITYAATVIQLTEY